MKKWLLIKWISLFVIFNLFFSFNAFSELSGGVKRLKSSAVLNEKEYKCLNARQNLESIFSQNADHFNQPFSEIRDAVLAYKKLNCVYISGFLFTNSRQVNKYFKYKTQNSLPSRAPASID